VSTPIPRGQILEIMERHNDFWHLDRDPPAEAVRSVAADLRTGEFSDKREAQELDALVDRIEAGQ
jgi:hypothetical protein